MLGLKGRESRDLMANIAIKVRNCESMSISNALVGFPNIRQKKTVTSFEMTVETGLSFH